MPGFDPMLLLVLNLAGTFAFGLSGGMAGVRARLDLLASSCSPSLSASPAASPATC
jgi:uncharacterized membrane protein YeiH